jgi:hypothetical protein
MPDPRSGRSVVLAPGGNNSAQIPLLMYSRLAAQRRGACVEVVTWEFGEDRGISQQRGMVTSTVEAATGTASPGPRSREWNRLNVPPNRPEPARCSIEPVLAEALPRPGWGAWFLRGVRYQPWVVRAHRLPPRCHIVVVLATAASHCGGRLRDYAGPAARRLPASRAISSMDASARLVSREYIRKPCGMSS